MPASPTDQRNSPGYRKSHLGLYSSSRRIERQPSRHVLRCGSRPSASCDSVVGTSVTRRPAIVALTIISIAYSIPVERMSSAATFSRSKPRSPQ